MDSQPSRWKDPIAIVGMACRLPGGIDKPQDLWNHVQAKRSAASKVPQDRFTADNFLSMDPNRPGCPAFTGAHFIKRDIKQFDHKFFGISKDTAIAMDPQQKQLLEVVHECLESAGVSMDSTRGSRVGCFCAMFVSDYHDMLMQDPEYLPTFIAIGTTRTMLANRVSHVFDFRGPSVTLDTACSGALVALHLACQALHNRECDSAVVGASNLFLSPDYALALAKLGAIASDGECKTFDASANGYGRGEGTNAVYLKRLSDALRDGDNIRGVIRGTASNSSGATPSITEPSALAQSNTILQAYEQAGIRDLNTTGYFECHGTGTPVGDCIELAAVGSVFASGRDPQDALWVGSTKPNVGHSEAASGLTSIIKVVLALEKGLIPPNTNFKNPNPKIDFEGWKVRVATDTHSWPSKAIRRASVNSLGIGGSNAHAIIEIFTGIQNGLGPIERPLEMAEFQIKNQPSLLFLSGASKQSLELNVSNMLEFLKRHETNKYSFLELVRALNVRSQIHTRPWKTFAIASNVSELIQALESGDIKSRSTPCKSNTSRNFFVFTGQGAMWSQMGKALLETFAVARATLHDLDQVLRSLQSAKTSPWSLIERLTTELSPEEFDSPELAQPLSMAVQIALVDILTNWGVHPDAVAGHSGGEIAAAYACGAITSQEAITVAYHRGTVCANAPKGAMLAVKCSPNSKELQDVLTQNGVSIACFNGPKNLTLAGSVDGVQKTMTELSSLGIPCRNVRVTRAYHTSAMEGPASDYLSLIKDAVHPRQSRVPMYSSVTGERLNGSEMDGSYWAQNLVSPVLYTDAIKAAITQTKPGFDICLEVGPHSLLSRPTQEIQQSLAPQVKQVPFLRTMMRESNTALDMMGLAGDLILSGQQLHLREVNGYHPGTKGERQPLDPEILDDLAPYAWDYSSTPWVEPRSSLEWRFRRAPRHEILGSRSRGVNPSAPTWRNKIAQGDGPWLVDHQINGVVTFSFTTCIAMVVEAMMQVEEERGQVNWADCSFEFENFDFSNSIILPDEAPIEIFLTLNLTEGKGKSDEAWADFTISSLRGDVDTRHCQGKIAVIHGHDDDDVSLELISSTELPLKIPSKNFYRSLSRVGYGYGPSFQLVSDVRLRPGSHTCTAKIDMASALKAPLRGQRYILHPALMDAALQTASFSRCSGSFQELDAAFLPSRMGRISLRIPSDNTIFAPCVTKTEFSGFGRVMGTVECYDSKSRPFFSIDGLQMNQAISENTSSIPWLRLVWRPDIGDVLENPIATSLLEKNGCATEPGLESLESMVEKLVVLLVNKGVNPSNRLPPHMDHYHSWLVTEAERIRLKHGDTSSQDTVDGIISDTDISHTVDAQIVSKLANNMSAIFRAETEALSVWLEDELLYRFYEDSLFTDGMNRKLSFVAELLAHKNPNLKVLEIGAGTGGATSQLLRGFGKVGDANGYQSYTFTDISAGFFERAKKKFAAWDRIEYRTLDVEKDPAEQGFNDKYDLVVAANVLHATSDLNNAMKHIRGLLNDDGHILIAELSGDLTAAGFLWGGLTGWWLRPREPGRTGPGLTMDEWQACLAPGFEDVTDISPEGPKGEIQGPKSTVVMVARARHTDAVMMNGSPVEHVRIAGRSGDSHTMTSLQQFFNGKGLKASVSSVEALYQQQWSGEWLVVVDEADGSILSSLNPMELDGLKSWLSKPSHCIWVTRNVHLQPTNAAGGLVTGFARTIRLENSTTDFYTLDLSSSNDDAMASIIYRVSERIRRSRSNLCPKLDFELAEMDNQLWTCRLERDTRLEKSFGPVRELELPISSVKKRPHVLTVGEVGVVDSLVFAQSDEAVSLPDDQVLIDVKAVGLDARDAVTLQGKSKTRDFGRECAGIVARCGANTSPLQPGDRVVAIGQGAFATHYVAPSECCRRIPDWLTFEDAAAMPMSLVTAWYALVDVGRISPGQAILIANATSSLGVALMQLATRFTSKVFVTVAEEQQKHIPQACGISSSRILVVLPSWSRSRIRRAAKGETYHAILNTQSGQQERFSHLAATRGAYIEIADGRSRSEETTLSTPLNNVAFSSIDMVDVYHYGKEHLGRLLDRVMRIVEKQELEFNIPTSIVNATSLQQAFAALLGGDEKKQVVTFACDDSDNCLIKTRPEVARCLGEKTYIITGGLGGLGRAIAVWLASRGARNLVLATSSYTRAQESSDIVEQLSSYGCDTRVEVCDVGDSAAVERLVASIETPIGGVIHSALRLSDRFFEDMTLNDLGKVFGPKVDGCLNLHRSLRSQKLDFFVMLSSGCGIAGNEGQSNYAASSTFLDSFARYRHQLGLPATSIDLGFVEDVGNISERPEILASMAARGFKPVTVRDILRVMDAAVMTASPAVGGPSSYYHYDPYSQGQIVVSFGMIDKVTEARETWAKDSKFGILRSRKIGALTSDDEPGDRESAIQTSVKAFRHAQSQLGNAPEGNAEETLQPFVSTAFVAKLAQVLSLKVEEIQPKRSAVQYGMDSLIAIEVRSWSRYAFQVDLPINDLMNPYSIWDLAARVSRMAIEAGTKVSEA